MYLLIGVADVFGAQTMCTRPARRPQTCPDREIFTWPMPPDPTDTLTPAGRARSTDRTLAHHSYLAYEEYEAYEQLLSFLSTLSPSLSRALRDHCSL